jgi:hypothetical protein
MKVNGGGAGANINMGVVSRPVVGFGDGSDHDNGRRAHGKPDSFRSDFRSLLRAVKSGDMTSAQSALATIKSDVASASATYSPASTSAPAESPVGADLKALFDAVGTGDATSAQAALSQFVSDRRDAWQSQTVSDAQGQQTSGVQGHHGRRHSGLESLIASLFSSSTSDSTSTETPIPPTTDAPPTDTTATDTPPADTTTPSDSAAPETVAA